MIFFIISEIILDEDMYDAYLPFYDIFYNILRSFVLTPVRQSVDHRRSFSTSVIKEKGIPQKKVYVDRIPICRE